MNKANCIEICNQLLRGELSAIETYSQAINKLKSNTSVTRLERIKEDHELNAEMLRKNVISMGADPDTDSGSWGTFAQLVEGGAKLFGERAALGALIEGEEHGVKEYQEALSNEDVMPICKTLIRSELLPKQKEHISELRNISAAVVD